VRVPERGKPGGVFVADRVALAAQHGDGSAKMSRRRSAACNWVSRHMTYASRSAAPSRAGLCSTARRHIGGTSAMFRSASVSGF
jgi:hypothetical protein